MTLERLHGRCAVFGVVSQDGRHLGYAEFGDPEGTPVIYCHGLPGSRLEARPLDGVARSLHLRIIAPDRPGMGRSTFQPGRTIGAWPQDVIELTEGLGLRRVAVLGVSGGGPYAAACARRIPERITVAAIVGGLGPFGVRGATTGMRLGHRVMFFMARAAPWLLGVILGHVARGLASDPAGSARRLAARFPEPDRSALVRPGVGEAMMASTLEAFREGTRGVLLDLKLAASTWDFRLEDIDGEVWLWHGECDSVVPVAMGWYVSRAIPRCRAIFCPEEGHFSLPMNRMSEIMERLTR